MMNEPPIVPLSGKSNVAIVRESLEEIIKGGFWKPGDKLPTEAELCAKYNVGRSTVREALNMLKAQEMLYTVPGQGTFVKKKADVEAMVLVNQVLDPKSEMDLLNIMELRLSLEPLNAAFAARRATNGHIEELHKNMEMLSYASSQGDARLFAQCDLNFHMIVARATANPILSSVMDTVRHFFHEQQILTSRSEGRRSTALDVHTRLLESIEKHDERLAEDLMREHMDDTYIYVKSQVNISERRSGRWVPRKVEISRPSGKKKR